LEGAEVVGEAVFEISVYQQNGGGNGVGVFYSEHTWVNWIRDSAAGEGQIQAQPAAVGNIRAELL